jgi:large conductance mechanosensitive channel
VLKGFRDFIMRGNVIELAVAVVIGTAFNNVVTTFSSAFIKPLIEAVSGGGVNAAKIHVYKNAYLDPGSFLNALINFLVTAAVVYFFFVYPMNKLAERRKRGEEPEPEAPSDEVRLLTEIRDALVTRNGAVQSRPGQTPPVAPPSQR